MKKTKYFKTPLCIFLCFAALFSIICFSAVNVHAEEYCTITYEFTGENADTPGYAEGTVTLTSHHDGYYMLYWVGSDLAPEDFYPIMECTLADGESKSVDFGYHTAIPPQADGIIAFSEQFGIAAAHYYLPQNKLPEQKQLFGKDPVPLYTFSSYSDVHMDDQGYYKKAQERWANALEFAAKKNTDFIVTSGDMVTNNLSYDRSHIENEWRTYLTILNDSSYCNPVWESDGNHDMHTIGKPGLQYFIKATGTDDLFENFVVPYYYIIEPKTGDLFIFMALEESSEARTCDEFSLAQRYWVEDLLDRYYGTGVNIYIVEHAPIEGFGAGDRMDNQYYTGLLSTNYESTVWLKNILTEYKNVIHMSGHTHEDFSMGYNYSDENGTACNMIHNPSVACTTMPNIYDNALDYNNGIGNGSQGYYVEVYEDEVIYYGADLTEGLIYPFYSYIMEGTRQLDHNGHTQPDEPDTPDIPIHTDIVPISGELAKAKEILDYYDGASFTLHQKLKMLYNAYRSEMYAPEYIRDEIVQKTDELRTLYEAIGVKLIYPIGDTYYFVDSYDWGSVYAYAYRPYSSSDPNSNDIRNGIYPGVKMKKVGTLDGHDVYRIRFDKKAQYEYISFSCGTTRTETTALRYCKYNCFIPDGDSGTNNIRLNNIEYVPE